MRAAIVEIGGARIKFYAGSKVLKCVQGPARVIPRGDDDGGVYVVRLHGPVRIQCILAGRERLAFQLDIGSRHTRPHQDVAIDYVVAVTADQDARRGVLEEQLSGALGSLMGPATAQDDNDVRPDGAAVHAQKGLRKEIQSGGQEQ